jgi:hypothetical protein
LKLFHLSVVFCQNNNNSALFVISSKGKETDRRGKA